MTDADESVAHDYGSRRHAEQDLQALDVASGAWRDQKIDGETYVEGVRSGDRLSETSAPASAELPVSVPGVPESLGEPKPAVSEAEIQRRMDFADAASDLTGHQVTDPVLRALTRQVAAETLTAEEANAVSRVYLDARASRVRRDGAALASRLTAAIGRNQGDVVAALKSLFAWTSEFTPEELAAYAAEIEPLASSASDRLTYESLLRAQRSWQQTAAAYASGMRPAGPIEVPAVPSSQRATVDRIIGRTFEAGQMDAPTIKGHEDGI